MTSILRVYDPSECDSNGAPLDGERCRACLGTGQIGVAEGFYTTTCPTCDGHGSLKAAALAAMAHGHPGGAFSTQGYSLEGMTARCEGCGHPMSEGTWERPAWDESGAVRWDADRIVASVAIAEVHLVHGWEPEVPGPYGGRVLHYSPCDERCKHGEPGRFSQMGGPWEALLDQNTSPAALTRFPDTYKVEASWRPVDVRMLGEPNDLRPEMLAVLCLRCLADRRPTEAAAS